MQSQILQYSMHLISFCLFNDSFSCHLHLNENCIIWIRWKKSLWGYKFSCVKLGDALTCGKILEKDFWKNYLSTCVTLRRLRDNDRRASDVWPLFRWPEISNGIIMWMRWGIWGKISCIQLMNKISIFVHWFYASGYSI